MAWSGTARRRVHEGFDEGFGGAFMRGVGFLRLGYPELRARLPTVLANIEANRVAALPDLQALPLPLALALSPSDPAFVTLFGLKYNGMAEAGAGKGRPRSQLARS